MSQTMTENLQRRILEKASQDDAFHRLLLANPKRAVEQELGVALPSGLEIVAVEERPDRICLVLPMRGPAAGAHELTEEDLERVSGGDIPGPMPCPPQGFDRLGLLVGDRVLVGDRLGATLFSR